MLAGWLADGRVGQLLHSWLSKRENERGREFGGGNEKRQRESKVRKGVRGKGVIKREGHIEREKENEKKEEAEGELGMGSLKFVAHRISISSLSPPPKQSCCSSASLHLLKTPSLGCVLATIISSRIKLHKFQTFFISV